MGLESLDSPQFEIASNLSKIIILLLSRISCLTIRQTDQQNSCHWDHHKLMVETPRDSSWSPWWARQWKRSEISGFVKQGTSHGRNELICRPKDLRVATQLMNRKSYCDLGHTRVLLLSGSCMLNMIPWLCYCCLNNSSKVSDRVTAVAVFML